MLYGVAVTASNTSSPVVLLGRRGRTARLTDGALVLRSRRETRHVPLAAIERIDLPSDAERELVVVLTRSADGTEQPSSDSSYRVAGRNTPAVRAFAEEVRRALPPRKAEVLPGAREVKVERHASDRHPLLLTLVGLVGVCYLTGIVLLLVLPTGDRASAMSTDEAVGFWAFAPALAAVGLFCLFAGGMGARDWWVLRTRGVTVEGSLWLLTRDDEGAAETIYEFTAADGTTHRRTTAGSGPERIDITYDPRNPELNTEPDFTSTVVLPIVMTVIGLGAGAVAVFFWVRSGGELIGRAF